jgi:hypothetical protein
MSGMEDLHTDGNHVAGMLAEFLAVDATTTRRRCQWCGSEQPLAAHRAYRGAGVVLRCRGCGDVAIVVAECGDELVLHWRGAFRARRS